MSQKWQMMLCTAIFFLSISGCIHYSEKDIPKNSNELIEFLDTFNEQKLNLKKWQITRNGDFSESTIDIFDVDPGEGEDYRLRLRADTIGTQDDTVKYHGVRYLHKIKLNTNKLISVTLDWNNQKNGCYLTAAVYFCPTITNRNPDDEKDWLKLEYIGVPPGKNARCAISTKINNRLRYLYTEDWPEKREGRLISRQKIGLIIDEKGFRFQENGQNLYGLERHGLNFSTGYLYLQMSSHSNYPGREIYFDDVLIKPSDL